MRPNLSFETIASVLAALGASTLVACGSATPPPVNASDVTVPSASAKPAGQASCSASGCGANAAAAPAAPATPATGAAAATTPAASATPAAPAAASAPAAVAAAPASSAAPAAPAKPVARKSKPKANPGAEASCGQGTCSADSKPKIF
jgi:hypothetical protein